MMDFATFTAIAIAAIVGVTAGYGLHIYLSKPKGGPGATSRTINPPYETCPTCGAAVRVAGEGSTHWYEPIPVPS